jgi:hypothetical protein
VPFQDLLEVGPIDQRAIRQGERRRAPVIGRIMHIAEMAGMQDPVLQGRRRDPPDPAGGDQGQALGIHFVHQDHQPGPDPAQQPEVQADLAGGFGDPPAKPVLELAPEQGLEAEPLGAGQPPDRSARQRRPQGPDQHRRELPKAELPLHGKVSGRRRLGQESGAVPSVPDEQGLVGQPALLQAALDRLEDPVAPPLRPPLQRPTGEAEHRAGPWPLAAQPGADAVRHPQGKFQPLGQPDQVPGPRGPELPGLEGNAVAPGQSPQQVPLIPAAAPQDQPLRPQPAQRGLDRLAQQPGLVPGQGLADPMEEPIGVAPPGRIAFRGQGRRQDPPAVQRFMGHGPRRAHRRFGIGGRQEVLEPEGHRRQGSAPFEVQRAGLAPEIQREGRPGTGFSHAGSRPLPASARARV